MAFQNGRSDTFEPESKKRRKEAQCQLEDWMGGAMKVLVSS